MPSKGHLVLKNFPSGFLNKIENKSGKFALLDKKADIIGQSLYIVSQDVDEILKPKKDKDKNKDTRRRLVETTGNRSVLVARVIAAGSGPSSSVATLRDNAFYDSVNLVKQYKACSYDKLHFYPAPTNATINVDDGVHEVSVSQSSFLVDNSVVKNAVTEQLKVDLQNVAFDEDFDHVMYCLPPG